MIKKGIHDGVQLSVLFCCSRKTIQCKLDKVHVPSKKEFAGVAGVIMNTAYFWRLRRDGF
jgi:hypothetical protein